MSVVHWYPLNGCYTTGCGLPAGEPGTTDRARCTCVECLLYQRPLHEFLTVRSSGGHMLRRKIIQVDGHLVCSCHPDGLWREETDDELRTRWREVIGQ